MTVNRGIHMLRCATPETCEPTSSNARTISAMPRDLLVEPHGDDRIPRLHFDAMHAGQCVLRLLQRRSHQRVGWILKMQYGRRHRRHEHRPTTGFRSPVRPSERCHRTHHASSSVWGNCRHMAISAGTGDASEAVQGPITSTDRPPHVRSERAPGLDLINPAGILCVHSPGGGIGRRASLRCWWE